MIRIKGRWAHMLSAKRAEDDAPSWVDPDAGGATAGRPEERDSSPAEEKEESAPSEGKKGGAQERITGLIEDRKALREELKLEREGRTQLERRTLDLERNQQTAAPAQQRGNGDMAEGKNDVGLEAYERQLKEQYGDDTATIAFARGLRASMVESVRAENETSFARQIEPLRNLTLQNHSDTEIGRLEGDYGKALVGKHRASVLAYHTQAGNDGRYLTVEEAFKQVVPATEISAELQKTEDAQARLRNEADTLEGGPDRDREAPPRALSSDEQEVIDRMVESGMDKGAIDAIRRGE